MSRELPSVYGGTFSGICRMNLAKGVCSGQLTDQMFIRISNYDIKQLDKSQTKYCLKFQITANINKSQTKYYLRFQITILNNLTNISGKRKKFSTTYIAENFYLCATFTLRLRLRVWLQSNTTYHQRSH